MRLEGGEPRASIKRFFQGAFRSLLGDSGSKIFELHMRRVLGADPYDVLYGDPRAFYGGLKRLFGPGADALLKLFAKDLIAKYDLEGVSPEEFLELVERGDEKSRERLIALVMRAIG